MIQKKEVEQIENDCAAVMLRFGYLKMGHNWSKVKDFDIKTVDNKIDFVLYISLSFLVYEENEV